MFSLLATFALRIHLQSEIHYLDLYSVVLIHRRAVSNVMTKLSLGYSISSCLYQSFVRFFLCFFFLLLIISCPHLTFSTLHVAVPSFCRSARQRYFWH
jgi:hypothetical protein